MSTLLEHISRISETAQLESTYAEELQCEVPDHNDPRWSHLHGGPGEFMGILSCGRKAIICRPLRDNLVANGTCTCPPHGSHIVTAANFIEL